MANLKLTWPLNLVAFPGNFWGIGKSLIIFWEYSSPQKGVKRREELSRVMNSLFDIILYEAPHRVEKLIGEIVEIDKSRELFLAKELTKLHQRYIRDSAENILEMFRDSKIDIRGEWVVIIEANHLHHKDIL